MHVVDMVQAMDLAASAIALRNEDFYKNNNIELELGKEVREIYV